MANRIQLHYNQIDNFAPSYPIREEGIEAAALVDNDLLGDLLSKHSFGPVFSPLPDFRTQVEHWIEFEQNRTTSDLSHISPHPYIFTVFFGTWDVLELTQSGIENPLYAIQEAILYLFDQLDIIAERLPTPPTIVLLNMFDLTFTPRYQRQLFKQQATNTLFDAQRHAISVVKEWNKYLRANAQEWTNGHLIYFEVDKWLVRQLRQSQLYNYEYRNIETEDTNPMPAFNETIMPCYTPTTSTDSRLGKSRCVDPGQYLFW
jgi:hypothetical protein